MARFRHLGLTLLALIGLFSTLGWSMAAPACPVRAQASHMAMPHGHHAPRPSFGGDMPVCGVCMAVLPQITLIELHPLLPLAPLVARLLPLSGFASALDPPPPRTA